MKTKYIAKFHKFVKLYLTPAGRNNCKTGQQQTSSKISQQDRPARSASRTSQQDRPTRLASKTRNQDPPERPASKTCQ
jgi:hypothetical protein